MKKLIAISAIIFSGFGLFATSGKIFAATPRQSQVLQVQGLAIDPFLIETDEEPGKATIHTINLSNTTDQPLPITISINDFIPSSKSGQAIFLDTNQTSSSQFSLSSWISIIKQPKFTIPAHGTTEVQFSITPPVDAEPGTHYGGLLFAYDAPHAQTGSQVTEKIGTIVLAKLGKSQEKGRIDNFYINQSTTDVNFILTFQNIGNVHLKPKGEIYITNTFGKRVGDLYVNPNAQIVLPETQRDFDASWHPGHWSFGRYTATTVMYYGFPKIELRGTVHFWIVPWQGLLLTFTLTIIIILGLYFGIKKYNQWLIKKNT